MTTPAEDDLRIEVVYAEPDRQELIVIQAPAGTTAADALAAAGLAEKFPGVDFKNGQLGVWGRPVAHDHVLRNGDRLEVYRPLRMDPREARRQLATHGRAMGQKDSAED